MSFYSKQKYKQEGTSLLHSIIKICLLLTATTSLLLSADELKVEKLETEHSKTCPVDFYTLPIVTDAKFCQQFSTTPPASLSYHTQQQQTSTKQFYLDTFGPAEDEQVLKGRIVLQYSQGQKIVIISPDGQGSQVDILVKG